MTVNARTLIAELVSDTDPDLRRRAAEALVTCGDRTAVGALASALQDENKGVRDAAFRSLQAVGGEAVAEAIVQYIGSPNIVTRNLASDLLVRLGESAVGSLLPYLAHESQDVRKFAVDILGLIGHAVPISPIVPLLGDADENVVVSAVEALGNIGSADVLDHLYRAYDRLDYAKAAVAEALGKIGDRSACGFLQRKFEDSLADAAHDPSRVFAIVEALGVIGESQAAALLRKNVGGVRGKLRSAVLHALVQIAHRAETSLECPGDMIPDFLDALRDSDPAIRLSAAQALTDCSQNVVTYALIEALGSSSELDAFLTSALPRRPDTFGTAIRYLEEHRAEPAKQVILLIGKMASEMARMIMRNSLTESLERQTNRAFILIADRWVAADEETRAAIVDVLFRLDGDNAVEFLDAIMNDPDPWLRMHVIEIIAAISDPRAPEFIARFLEDDDAMVREVAVGILQSRGYAVDAPEV